MTVWSTGREILFFVHDLDENLFQTSYVKNTEFWNSSSLQKNMYFSTVWKKIEIQNRVHLGRNLLIVVWC